MRKPTTRSLSKHGSCGGGNSKAATLPAKQKVVVSGHRGFVVDAFDCLPDDLVLAVLAGLAARAGCPADLAAAALPCRRFRDLAAHPAVLSRASAAAVAVPAGRWSDAAHRFLRRCAAAGNLHACYFLGMVRFYCIGSRATGAALLARAAAGGHGAALYALAVVQFNGSGGDKADKDPRAGVALCARAAWLGHVPALRELGHCLQDGYGARRDAAAGRHFLLHAAARELVSSSPHRRRNGKEEEDAASRFMVEWWALDDAKTGGGEGDGSDADADVRLCSHPQCGRRETRRHEFRRCSACGSAIYCSRACQALDWKRVHRAQCAAAASRWWLAAAGNAQ
ncbi:F-box protein At1g67340-like isoform X2 [Miscanthus floridulus]|uniref:F-box protein At1g67340-like isoform X2 n=1 Tax=Miscanthus floridulus TaxID=154761 RepID=UPI00345B333E